VVLVSAGLISVNAMHVGNFGELEYWFAMIKVIAILVFIVTGAALISGVPLGHAIGWGNLTQNGGFFPHGLRGVWLALTLVITS
jgi:amino acid transporter, AAT family